MTDSFARHSGVEIPGIGSGDEQRLLGVARYALETRVRGGPPPDPPCGGAFDALCGAFVSLHVRRALRGCLGSLDREAPLGLTIVRLSALVADSDPRFAPVTEAELAHVDIEISVLTPERPVEGPDEIQIGRHGVILQHGRHRGLLLPRVALDHGWDRETLLEQLCVKSGLPRRAWRQGARLYVFDAQVFGERETDG